MSAQPFEQIHDARSRSDRGRPARVFLAAGCAVLATAAVDWRWMGIFLIGVVIWEFLVAPWLDQIAETRQAHIGEAATLRRLAVHVFIGSAIYAAYPIILFSADSALGAYLAMAWLMGTLLHVFVYYSSAAILLFPQAALPAILLLAHPFQFLSRLDHAIFAAATLTLLLAALVRFTTDRNDLLSQVQLKERQRQSAHNENQSKTRILAHMSHELRTPLNSIIGYSELMRDTAVADQRADDIADHDHVLAAAKYLLRMINEILDITKLDSDQFRIEFDPCDIAALVDGVRQAVQPAMEANANTFVCTVDQNLPSIVTDAPRVEQCLYNIVSNAAKYTNNGMVSLVVRQRNGELDFIVSDTGTGIAAENLELVFEPFVRSEQTATQQRDGAGLGLAITRRLARRLGGDVAVESILGSGSTFTLTIPMSPREGSELDGANAINSLVLVAQKQAA